jgi:hypothetical protein
MPERHCFWTPDYSWLSLLRPTPEQVLTVSQAMQAYTADAAAGALTIAANAIVTVNWSLNDIVPGTWKPPLVNQAVVFESITFAVGQHDATGNITVQAVWLSLGEGYTLAPIGASVAVPYTFPQVADNFVWWWSIPPSQLLIPRNTASAPLVPSANGPRAYAVLRNADGAASHTYRRAMAATWRLVQPCEFSSGASLPGGGAG